MPIPLILDYVIDRLAGLQPRSEQFDMGWLVDNSPLTKVEEQYLWPQVLEHKWFMSERPGRDVGPQVAAIDYFENILPNR